MRCRADLARSITYLSGHIVIARRWRCIRIGQLFAPALAICKYRNTGLRETLNQNIQPWHELRKRCGQMGEFGT